MATKPAGKRPILKLSAAGAGPESEDDAGGRWTRREAAFAAMAREHGGMTRTE